jgi:hypothetical protein
VPSLHDHVQARGDGVASSAASGPSTTVTYVPAPSAPHAPTSLTRVGGDSAVHVSTREGGVGGAAAAAAPPSAAAAGAAGALDAAVGARAAASDTCECEQLRTQVEELRAQLLVHIKQ